MPEGAESLIWGSASACILWSLSSHGMVFCAQDVNYTQFDADTAYRVIDFLPGQQAIAEKGGTMRLGGYPCCMVAGTKTARAYRSETTVA